MEYDVLFEHKSRECCFSVPQQMALSTTYHLYFLPVTAFCDDHMTASDVIRWGDTDQCLSSVSGNVDFSLH